jgi:surface protein
MFYSATSFNQNLSEWNVSATTDTRQMFKDTLFVRLLHKFNLETPFDLSKTHQYHNWTRRKQFIHTEVTFGKVVQNKFITQTVLDILEMKQEIGLFI